MRTYESYLSHEIVEGDGDFGINDDDSDGIEDIPTRKRRRSETKKGIILDVAGGKGDLSWLLKNVDGLESIVLDPWRADPNTMSRNERMVRSIEYLRTHPEEEKQRSLPFLPSYQPLASLLPKLLEERSNRLRLHKNHPPPQRLEGGKKYNDLLESDSNGPCSPDDFLTPRILHVPLDEIMVQKVRNRILETNNSNTRNTTNRAKKLCNQADSATHEDQVVELLSSGQIKLIVGFHPDQATEPCIDLASVLGIPYCVVPCCVFPSEFPNRRVRMSASESRDGTSYTSTADQNNETQKLVPVRTYQQFLEYLKQKATALATLNPPKDEGNRNDRDFTKIQTGYLDFPFTETAKNIVLYTLPPSPSS